MRVIISQLRKANAHENLPQFIHNGYPADDYADMMFTADPGYEIAAVYIVPDIDESIVRNDKDYRTDFPAVTP